MTQVKYWLCSLSVVAVVAACAAFQGGGVASCPPGAVCGYVTLAGESIYVCASPEQMARLRSAAHKAENNR